MIAPLMLLNMIDSDSALKMFLEATANMSAADRAKELEKNKVRHCTLLCNPISTIWSVIDVVAQLPPWDSRHAREGLNLPHRRR